MIVAIADTPAVIWYLYSNPRLGKAASSLIDQTSAAGDQIGLSGSRKCSAHGPTTRNHRGKNDRGAS
jgi:hypothetical protein